VRSLYKDSNCLLTLSRRTRFDENCYRTTRNMDISSSVAKFTTNSNPFPESRASLDRSDRRTPEVRNVRFADAYAMSASDRADRTKKPIARRRRRRREGHFARPCPVTLRPRRLWLELCSNAPVSFLPLYSFIYSFGPTFFVLFFIRYSSFFFSDSRPSAARRPSLSTLRRPVRRANASLSLCLSRLPSARRSLPRSFSRPPSVRARVFYRSDVRAPRLVRPSTGRIDRKSENDLTRERPRESIRRRRRPNGTAAVPAATAAVDRTETLTTRSLRMIRPTRPR